MAIYSRGQLEGLPFGVDVIFFVESQIPRGTLWDFGVITKDKAEEGVYHACLDILTEPKGNLSFSFVVKELRGKLPTVTFGEVK